MLTVEVSQNGTELGKVNFRGVVVESAAATSVPHPEKRLYRCAPKRCIPKNVAQQIARKLSLGVQAGQESGYEWHT